jgi:hypothetical protein
MRFLKIIPFLLMLSFHARAVCVRPAEETPGTGIKHATTVFVATITNASLDPDYLVAAARPFSKEKSWYPVRYEFRVAIPMKGNPDTVPYLLSDALYNDPKSDRYHNHAEQSRFIPGDNILVVTSTPGPVGISRIPLCTDSMPWNDEARALVRRAGLLPARQTAH